MRRSVQLYKSVLSDAQLYVWNDMFDPYHNAVDHYYNVEGDLAGSWKGVPAEVSVMNWNLGNLAKSLRWFSGESLRQPTPHKQIVAGYYDTGDGAAAARKELGEAKGIPGVMGLMYTTWSDDYSQLEPFANAARAEWASYQASVASKSPGISGSGLLATAFVIVLTSGALAIFRKLRRQ
jgi:hypothetical protein